MIEKDLHGGAAQSVDYTYNERGWIKTINGGMAGDGDANDRFFLELNYDNAPTPQYGGNIGQMLWKTMGFSGNENQQSYDYSYDNLNRLKQATYNSSGKVNHYDVGGNDNGQISYDLNGNIKSLKRHHAGTLIDDLSFSHWGNRLTSVGDAASDTGEGFIEASDGLVANEYGYDANGNLTKDDNKGLTSIDYNILNLPRQVVKTNGNVITYVYDAAGTKLAKTIDDGSPETSYYDGPFHYIENVLQFIQTSEGRTRKSGSTFQYEYNLTDHLGNIRVSVDASGTVVQRDGYYPFGLTFNHSNVSPENEYKYNGFEEQKEWDVYDYQARFYDPTLGRFLNVDPAADLMRRHSVYSYAFNNPIRFIDPDGMMPDDQSDQHTDTGSASAVTDDVDPDELWRETYEKDGVTYIDIFYRADLTTAGAHNTVNGAGGFGEGEFGTDGDKPIGKNYKGKIQTGAATPIMDKYGNPNPQAYNCHSFAWCNSLGDPKDPANQNLVQYGITRWDNDPTNNTGGYTALQFSDANQVGDRLIYYAWDSQLQKVVPTHSAVVTKVDATGNTIEVESKWGQGPRFTHHPRDVPRSYGAITPTFVAPGGKTYASRIYFRKKPTP